MLNDTIRRVEKHNNVYKVQNERRSKKVYDCVLYFKNTNIGKEKMFGKEKLKIGKNNERANIINGLKKQVQVLRTNIGEKNVTIKEQKATIDRLLGIEQELFEANENNKSLLEARKLYQKDLLDANKKYKSLEQKRENAKTESDNILSMLERKLSNCQEKLRLAYIDNNTQRELVAQYKRDFEKANIDLIHFKKQGLIKFAFGKVKGLISKVS